MLPREGKCHERPAGHGAPTDVLALPAVHGGEGPPRALTTQGRSGQWTSNVGAAVIPLGKACQMWPVQLGRSFI